jgi:UDP-2-acetamido-2-deoxy-ribo-hexuluronate aminotransferase
LELIAKEKQQAAVKKMKLDFANLKLSYEAQKEEIDVAIQSVLSSASFIMGTPVFELEENLSAFTGAKHAIACSNGTDALLLAMMAIGIKPGDEVITSPFTFISTAESIALLGATPVFVDINEATFNIDETLIEAKITSKTKLIMPVSLFGQMPNMDVINKLATKHDLWVIEDGAQSFGATYSGKKSGNCSAIGTTSFFPAKPLGCFGDGGAVFTNDDELAERMKSIRVHGQTKKYHHKYIGLNGRLDTLQAAVLNVKLKSYPNDIKKRQAAAEMYNRYLKNQVQIPIIASNCTSVWAQYSIRVKNRDRIQTVLNDKGIPTAVYYPIPLHLQECFKHLNYKAGDFPVSELIAKEIISLPMNPFLSSAEIEYVSKELINLLS